MLTGDTPDPNLLLALFFSICSLWCTCQSSSSFLAFSLHSASAALDAESYRGAKAEHNVVKRVRERGKQRKTTKCDIIRCAAPVGSKGKLQKKGTAHSGKMEVAFHKGANVFYSVIRGQLQYTQHGTANPISICAFT